MAKRQIEKTAAAYLLDSTKEVLDSISKWRVELSDRGQEPPKGLSQIYGSTRRLRDYLHRCLTSFHQTIEIDLSAEDEQQLVSCMLLTLGTLDQNIAKQLRATPQEKAMLEEKKRILSEWCVTLANKMPERIPVAKQMDANTPTPRGVIAAIAKKLSASDAPMTVLRNAFARSSPAEPPTDEEVQWAHQALQRTQSPAAEASEPARKLEEIVDAKRMRDPRLRSMMGLDLRAAERSMLAADTRLSFVHLGSIFEAGVIDCALARRHELALQGTPEAWSLEHVLQKALGDRLTPADRGQLAQLLASRTLIRPCVQLTAPLAVTPSSFLDMLAFVRRIFTELGLVGSGASAPAAAPEQLATVGPAWSGIWSGSSQHEQGQGHAQPQPPPPPQPPPISYPGMS